MTCRSGKAVKLIVRSLLRPMDAAMEWTFWMVFLTAILGAVIAALLSDVLKELLWKLIASVRKTLGYETPDLQTIITNSIIDAFRNSGTEGIPRGIADVCSNV
ncbi:hypothetical protein KC19_2G112300 [Ceratodon purpureus]|uniref:Uncharacterized protein n=1 Tax=Ceratodon purpureus TaxID=3225 RepID=A0A8T0IWJ5_CERPU|nr:hypothetical protein KC19_2G112300 [Ceratodon purpureus]